MEGEHMAQEEKQELKVTIGEYKGNPTITLPTTADGKYPFTFGVTKAKAILKYHDDIRRFVEIHDKPKEPPKPPPAE